jgi:hypothetical protein
MNAIAYACPRMNLIVDGVQDCVEERLLSEI